MSYPVVKTAVKPGVLDCYLFRLRPGNLEGFLGHNPRSSNWKNLSPYLRDIYQTKQRTTQKARIDALDQYITQRLMDERKFGALPPISIIQFEPFEEGQLTPISAGCYSLDVDVAEARRVLIDGLARVTAVSNVRDRLEVENPAAFDRFKTFEFSVALYVPAEGNRLGPDIAGQLFTDFNSYAWPVSAAKAVADDVYNPYKIIADKLADSDIIRRHHGLKSGTPNLGGKDLEWTTELTMAQFCKIVVEGPKGYGKLTKPVSNPRVSSVDLDSIADQITDFLSALEAAVGDERFSDRAQLFRTAHGLYAIATVLHDALIARKTSVHAVVNGIAAVDWTWENQDFVKSIGQLKENKKTGDLKYGLNTGQGTITWLVFYLRKRCGIVMPKAA